MKITRKILVKVDRTGKNEKDLRKTLSSLSFFQIFFYMLKKKLIWALNTIMALIQFDNSPLAAKNPNATRLKRNNDQYIIHKKKFKIKFGGIYQFAKSQNRRALILYHISLKEKKMISVKTQTYFSSCHFLAKYIYILKTTKPHTKML